jgi:putative SOS response-associated peptidase YedK
MYGRFTHKLTWEELVWLYCPTLDQPARNTQARYDVCPTDPVDTIVERDGKRELVTMRWGLVPRWWPKPIKELRAATFNARAETVETKAVFPRRIQAHAMFDPDQRLLRTAEYAGRQAALVFHGPRRVARPDDRRLVG